MQLTKLRCHYQYYCDICYRLISNTVIITCQSLSRLSTNALELMANGTTEQYQHTGSIATTLNVYLIDEIMLHATV